MEGRGETTRARGLLFSLLLAMPPEAGLLPVVGGAGTSARHWLLPCNDDRERTIAHQ